MAPMNGSVSVALVHHPVKNRVGEVISATTDEFDFFDGARLTLVYPVRRFVVIQPTLSQQALVRRLLDHGLRAERDVGSRGCFDHAMLVGSLPAAVELIEAEDGVRPTVVVTTAVSADGALSFPQVRERVDAGEHVLIVFGKAWGLADEVMEFADVRLAPVSGGTGFDHLPVRAAMAIVLDRLLGLP